MIESRRDRLAVELGLYYKLSFPHDLGMQSLYVATMAQVTAFMRDHPDARIDARDLRLKRERSDPSDN